MVAVPCGKLAHLADVLVEHRTHRLFAHAPKYILGQLAHVQAAGQRHADLGRLGVQGLSNSLWQIGIVAQFLLELDPVAWAHVVQQLCHTKYGFIHLWRRLAQALLHGRVLLFRRWQLVVGTGHEQGPQRLLDEKLILLAVGRCRLGADYPLRAGAAYAEQIMQRHAAGNLPHRLIELFQKRPDPI